MVQNGPTLLETPEKSSESPVLASNLRECISDELNELAHYGAKKGTLILHPKTFALLDNKIPPSLTKCRVLLDSGMKVGSFRVE